MSKSIENALSDVTEALELLKAPDDDEYRSAYRKTTFDNTNVVASFTMFDNDFTQVIKMFVDSISDEASSTDLDVLDKKQKVEYFKKLWAMTCGALYTLHTCRAYQVAKWGDDLYEPNGWGKSEQSITYMTNNFRVMFDDDAQAEFDQFGQEGNGEFVFIDKKGVVGWA